MAATSSSPFPLATEQPYEYDGNKGNGADLGASGDSSQNSINLSQGGMIAIIVVVVIVSLVGSTSCIHPFFLPTCSTNEVCEIVATATLFFFAKKREWTMRETIRRSARKVVTVMTPRRTQFPDSVKDDMESTRGGRSKARFNKPRFAGSSSEDVEKGMTTKNSRGGGLRF